MRMGGVDLSVWWAVMRSRTHGGRHNHHGQYDNNAYQALHNIHLRQGALNFQSRDVTVGRAQFIFLDLVFIFAARRGDGRRL